LEPVLMWIPATLQASLIVFPAEMAAKNLALSAAETARFVPIVKS
jgi:hypothetical protein